MISKFSKIFMIAVLAIVLVAPVIVSAQDDTFGVNAVGGNLVLGKNTDLPSTIGNIINAALGFLGVVAIIIVLIGGFKYMTAGGAEEKAKDARKYIISGIIGLVIILAAYGITAFVINSLVNSTNG